MQIDDDKSNHGQSDILIVPILTTDPGSKDLEQIIIKNTSYFFLEPDEMTFLKQATLKGQQDLSKGKFVIGVWSRYQTETVIASIYQIGDDIEYLDSLPEYKNCRVGDLVTGLPADFQVAEGFFIK
ncbi:hypothetical protein [Companilactobacillus kimchiensis]|uniref:Uncharacterized protein n=1 Tax=Companilactobacillus kimchiensis TaxID=993692 RepID=A0A0R2LA60_9LACO|nr:hypothetical protein [Companilactobacillus kimchiensis]KRN98745.1 hypothetical protein IV57_GL000858 [Companilactobacillus kimchiensis]